MSTLDDDDSPASDFIAVEAEHDNGDQQALWVGVRPIWYGDQRGEVMVQLCYQQQYNASTLAGPVWLTPQTWRDLNRAVEWRLRRHEPLYKRFFRKLTGKIK